MGTSLVDRNGFKVVARNLINAKTKLDRNGTDIFRSRDRIWTEIGPKNVGRRNYDFVTKIFRSNFGPNSVLGPDNFGPISVPGPEISGNRFLSISGNMC